MICATTFDPSSAEVAAYAHKFAAQQGAEVVFFHVKSPGSQEDVDWMSFEQAFRHYIPEDLGEHSWVRIRVASAAPGSSIVDLAKQCGSDLIVMGARSASAVAMHLPAGTAASVLREAPCPVMTLRQAWGSGAQR